MLSATTVVLVCWVVVPQGFNAYRLLDFQKIGAGKDAASSSILSSSSIASSGNSAFVPIPPQNHAKLQRSRADHSQLMQQYSKNDVPGGIDDEFDEHVHAEADSTLAAETNSAWQSLESIMNQNPYLGLISQVQKQSLRAHPALAHVWTELEKFVKDCESQIEYLAYIRSTFGAYLKDFQSAKKSDDTGQLKMLKAKQLFLLREAGECKERLTELQWRSETFTHTVQTALQQAGFDVQQREALQSCLNAKNAAWRDANGALERTQDRFLRSLGL
jgi:hypothetical protein